MAKIVIIRPNGETEYAELTTDKSLAGNDRLAVEKAGTIYYAKLDSGIGTHMFVIKPDGRKLYVQKEVVAFTWKYTFDITDFDTFNKDIPKMVIPRTGKYQLTYADDPDNQYNGQEIFKEGDKFIRESEYGWYIQGKTKRYYNLCDSYSGGGPCPLASIEYIGEA